MSESIKIGCFNILWVSYAVCLLGVFIVSDIETLLCCIAFLGISNVIAGLFLKGYENETYRVYLNSLFAYVTICYIYMHLNEYNYLLAFDTINAFLPRTQEYLSGNSLSDAITQIWKDYNILNRLQVGFYSLLTLFGSIARIFNADIYITIQVGLIVLCSYISVIIYKLFKILGLDSNTCYKYSLLISILSPLFYYSTTILRDGIVALVILSTIYLFFLPYTFRNVIYILSLIFLLTTFRIETGLMMLIFLPFYYLIIKKKGSISFLICLGAVCYILWSNLDGILIVYENNQNFYTEGIESQSGIIGMLQRLPFGISHLLSSIYTSLTPIPFWSKMIASFDPTRPECYNIMVFPTAVSAFFNLFTLVILTIGLINKTKIHYNIQKLKIILVPTIICIFLQAAVVAQRRVMALYVIIYILAFCLYSSMNKARRAQGICVTFFMFCLINIFGLFFLNK